MDISCKKCGQKYHVPDEKVNERRLYFNCEKCDYKIIIDHRREAWWEFEGLSREKLSSRDIFEGFFYSFNKRNVLFTFFLLLIFTAFIFILSLVFTRNMDFFTQHPSLSAFIIYFFGLLMVYIFDIHLYLLSKSIFHNISYKGNISFSSIAPEVNNDLKPIFFISIGFIILFSIFFFPVYLMKSNYSLVYEGIFHIFNLSLVSLIFFIFFFKGIIYSFISFRVRAPKENFRQLLRLFRIENVNLPYYSIIISAVTFTSFCFLMFFIAGGMIAVFSMMAPVLGSGGMPVSGMFSAPFTGGMGELYRSAGGMFSGSSEGMILVLISTYIVFLFFLSYIINLNQSLCTTSIFIMESNPGRSVSRRALLLGAAGFVASLMLALILSF